MRFFLHIGFILSLFLFSSCVKSKHKIGDYYKGGIIFKVNVFGNGMVAAPSDYRNGIAWGCYDQLIEDADGQKIGKGDDNTKAIVKSCSETVFAAKYCSDFVSEGYDDWFLPSIEELELMYTELHANSLGGFSGDALYWSSSQNFSLGAWALNFSDGARINSHNKSDKGIKVRTVRTF